MSYDEHSVVTLVERLTLQELRLWVRKGWVRPEEGAAGLRFDEVDVARIRLLRDLKTDMSISADALPLLLSLIDRLNHTRHEFQCLQRALEGQPDTVRKDIVTRYAALREEPD